MKKAGKVAHGGGADHIYMCIIYIYIHMYMYVFMYIRGTFLEAQASARSLMLVQCLANGEKLRSKPHRVPFAWGAPVFDRSLGWNTTIFSHLLK